MARVRSFTMCLPMSVVDCYFRYFKSPTGALLGIYAASFFIPSIFTAFIGDYLSGRLGRRWCLFIGNAIIIAGTMVNTFANSIGMWCGGKQTQRSC